MRNYDNYTPEINYAEESQDTELARNTSDKTNSKSNDKILRRRKNKKNKTDKNSINRKNEKPENISDGIKKEPNSFHKFISWFKSPSARILAGIFLGCLTIYFAVSFCGYFASCISDKSQISAASLGYATGVQNPGGEGGARLSELLINQGFGLGSLVIIIWIGALSLKTLIGRPKFKTLDFTIKCLVALITVSLIIGLVTYSMHTQVNWGGYHGTYVNEFIINFIGNIGAVLLSIFMIAVFIVICLRDLIKWIVKVRKAKAEKRRIANEQKAARLAKEEEIHRMLEQEKIDDLRAGESTILSNISSSEETLKDETMDFGDSLSQGVTEYNIEDSQDLHPSDIEHLDENNTEHDSEDDSEEESPLYRKEKSDSAITESDGRDHTTDTTEGNPDESISEIQDEEVNSKMVVNVNQINQSNHNRFKPDIEHFEDHHYKFPPYDFLREGPEKMSVDENEQLENKHIIEQTLLDFGIPITRIEATVGPTVTLYEIVPDAGVKIAKIRSLADDISLRIAARGVRIIAPIPGKGTVGIEVANKNKQIVSMRSIIQSEKFQKNRYQLPIALGSTISNDVYIADLAKMPHLLVAGATGQGKSVGLNAIISSLLYCKAPHELKFVMIDPKEVEFSLYNKLKNHYMAAIPGEEDEPVITAMDKVEATLNSLCIEMDDRYALFKKAHAKKIEEYNAKIREGLLNPEEGHHFLPYIVVIVDEFADLIMQSGKNVEKPIARLGQKARAAGMHVIIATQRPSVNVITGLIKSNFPARISFRVLSGIDSKTILDTTGAQQLIGMGDMLVFNNTEMVRVQCAFIDTPEVEKIVDYVDRQPYPQGVYMLPEPKLGDGDGGNIEAGPIGDKDPLFIDVARAVVNSGNASTSSVQRHYEIGYNRAGRIMDQLERAGIVGPSQGGKPRSVLVDPMRLEEILAEI